MKNLLFAVIFVFIITGCTQSVDLMKEIPGTYSLSELVMDRGDNSNTYKDFKMLKIYTESHFMFTQINPRDSVVTFGVGKYSASGDTLIEHSMYRSIGATFIDQSKDYHLHIQITPEGYTQFIKDIVIDSTAADLTEFYDKVKSDLVSPLDGVWKETESYMIIEGDTLPNVRTQFKAFYKGYFMFGNTVQVGNDKTESGMGYGTFKIIDDNTIEEIDLNSSYPVIAGNTFTVKYEMPDSDHFVQRIDNADGSVGIEYYERLK